MQEPQTHWRPGLKSNSGMKYMERKPERTIDRDVAKPLRMLSAYRTTSAVRSPPSPTCHKFSVGALVKIVGAAVGQTIWLIGVAQGIWLIECYFGLRHHLSGDGGDEGVPALEKAVEHDGLAVGGKGREDGQEEADGAHLDVAGPEGGGRVLEDALEVDAGKAAHEARGDNGAEAHDWFAHGRCGGGGTWELDEGDSRDEDAEGEPLEQWDLLSEHTDREECGREDLELVGDLAGGGVEVGCGDVEQIVLQHVDEGRHRHEQRVLPVNNHVRVHSLSDLHVKNAKNTHSRERRFAGSHAASCSAGH
jgi:hypothetical protein